MLEGIIELILPRRCDGTIHEVQASIDAPSISHLLFADDSLIFANVDPHEVVNLKQILLLYEAAAGQKLNFDKSAVAFGPGVRAEVKEGLLQILGVQQLPFHERYLGLHTVVGRNKKEIYKKQHERLDFHLSSWNNKLLSKVGKMTLIKSVAQVLPNYSMSVFKLPKGVLKAFQSKIARFCWGKEGDTLV